MKKSHEPLDRLLHAASRVSPRAVSEPPLGWEARVLRGVRDQRSAGMALAFAAIWRQGVVWAFATAVLVASFSAWNIKAAGISDPERLALEPVELYQVMR